MVSASFTIAGPEYGKKIYGLYPEVILMNK
jgi:hypothetical protein